MADGDLIELTQFDRRLGRHINHDPRNREYAVAIPKHVVLPTTDARHRVYGDRLDQGNLGSCTAQAGTAMLNAHPYHTHFGTDFDEQFAIKLYEDTTLIDPFPGSYPPDDTGSDGGSVCKELKLRGMITGYEWAFGWQQGIARVKDAPFMQGTNWLSDMFTPNSSGRVKPTGSIAGGHEYLWVGYEIRSKLTPMKYNRSWFCNSWGAGWAINGFFYMTWQDHDDLLNQQGDLVRATRF